MPLRRELPTRQQRAVLQQLHRDELEQAGTARRSALDQAETQLGHIRRLLPGAVRSGLSVSEIARITGVSRPTLYDLLRTAAGADSPDLRVLASVSTAPLSTKEIGSVTGIRKKAVDEVLGRLIQKGWVEELVPSRPRDPSAYAATDAGERALAEWDLVDPPEEETTKTLRVMLDLLRFRPNERADVENKVARARAQGRERLGLLEALRMGIDSELDRMAEKRRA